MLVVVVVVVVVIIVVVVVVVVGILRSIHQIPITNAPSPLV